MAVLCEITTAATLLCSKWRQRVNYYTMWCDLKNPSQDVEFSRRVSAYLQMLVDKDRIADFRITRRKLGFGPSQLGEFQITIHVENLAQLDTAFDLAATRAGLTEHLHAAVYTMVTNFRAGLYRDFPDPVREIASKDNQEDGS